MTIFCPFRSPAALRPIRARITPSQTAAASSKLMPAGLCASGALSCMQMNSACVPNLNVLVVPKTWSPTPNSWTASPTASTSPASSVPRIRCFGRRSPVKKRLMNGLPARTAQSDRVTVVACILTSTSCSLGTGCSTSSIRRTSGAPYLSKTTALIGPARASAKRAVEGDLCQGTLENGQLLVVQVRDEEIRNAAQVHRSCAGQPLQSGVCHQDDDTAVVGIGVATTNQAFVNEPGHPPGHAGTGDERAVRQLCHPQRTTGERQLSEHVVVGQGQAGLALEIGLKPAHEGGVGPEQRVPRLQSAPAWQRPRHDPIEASRSIGFR